MQFSNIILIFICLGILTFNVNRVIYVFIISIILFPLNTDFTIFNLDLTPFRIIVLITLIKIFFENYNKGIVFNYFDKFFLAFAGFSLVTYVILYGTTDALVNRLGFFYDTVLVYFILRVFSMDSDRILAVFKAISIATVFVSMSMFYEQMSGKNLFSVLGAYEFVEWRDGRYRSQGPFGHSILAGTFGAAVIPLLYFQYLYYFKRKFYQIFALFSAFCIVLFSSSSGPIISMLTGLAALLLWHFKKNLHFIRNFFFLTILLLHLYMKAPVWALVGRVKVFGVSTGYHRFMLIDSFINNFADWFLVGTKNVFNWGWYGRLVDITNYYVRIGVNGGIFTLFFFLLLIFLAFRLIGILIQRNDICIINQKFYWCIGSSLFVHVVSFFGVSYWDQVVVFYYLLFAIVSSSLFQTINFSSETNDA